MTWRAPCEHGLRDLEGTGKVLVRHIQGDTL
jgi:hypothetical protein